VPAFALGILLGPTGARFVNVSKWAGNDGDDHDEGSSIAYVCEKASWRRVLARNSLRLTQGRACADL
jgi:hypothetical protein